MRFEAFSCKPILPLNLPVAGNGVGYQGKSQYDELEMNGFSWSDDCENITIASIDSLYAGDLWRELNYEVDFLASHTHFAPMLDSKKPNLGEFSNLAVKKWKNAFKKRELLSHEIDSIYYFTTNVNIPIYRRFDNKGNILGLFANRYVGMFPNFKEPIDNATNIFLFCEQTKPKFCLVWHCCHPVSRRERNIYSADYISIIRKSIRKRFGEMPVIFANGPSGDIRPCLLKKRFNNLPDWYLNRKFTEPNYSDELYVDKAHEEAIESLKFRGKFSNIIPKVKKSLLRVIGYKEIEVKTIFFGEQIGLCLLPFEVSHRYNNIAQKKGVFIASCSNDVLGYLPHETQLNYGGYEVDKSREIMGLAKRIFVRDDDLYNVL